MNAYSNFTVNWRHNYEPFRGRVWEFGLYRIAEEGPHYVVYHGGTRGRLFKYWSEADQHAAWQIRKGQAQ